MGGSRVGAGDRSTAAAAAAVLLVSVASAGRPPTDLDVLAVLGYALLAVGALALTARRRAPVAVLAVTGLCAVGSQAAGVDAPAIAYLVAVYSAVRAGRRGVTVVASAAMLVALPLAALASGLHGGASGVHDTGEALARARDALGLAWLIAAGAAGEALRQAERRADEAERTREETARRRANQERLHIARELHDSLTQQISIIKVQAEVAVHLARKRGEEVPEPLLAILEAGREAARELRATLEALRDDENPAPGLDHVPALVQRARASGLDATLTIEGRQDDVPGPVDRTAYRIVQESLTNVARHAGSATASVRIAYGPEALAIQVDDDGRGTADVAPAPAPAAGVGLLGMRERVTALGGRFRAGPRSGGGFTVHVELPVNRTP